MILDLMDDHIEYYTWILENIYLYLGENIIENINIKYKEIFIYREKIPDFITGNELFFTNYNSNDYKTFITNKIKHFFSNEHEYNIIPSSIIWLKLCKLFNSYSLMIIYNRLFDAIKYFPPTVCFNNYKFIKNEPVNQIFINENEVYSSCLFDAYENFQINEFLCLYFEKIFYTKNYKLLNSELDFLDTHKLNNQKYNNLKYLVFRTGLTQWQFSNKNDMLDFAQIFDIDNPPNYQSIRFSLFVAWALCKKILLKNISPISYIEDTSLNINKLYNYFIYLINDNTGLLNKLVKWLDDLDWNEYEKTTLTRGCDELKLLDSYDFNTIFNQDNYLHKAYYDFPSNSNIKIKDVVGDNYILNNMTNQIEKSIFDNIEYLENEDENEDEDDDNNNDNNEDNKIQTNNNLPNHKGGTNKIIGIYELENGLGKIISTVPICKISNIIQFVK